MNILYITHCDPRKTDNGSAQRTHLLWSALRKKGTVYTLFAAGRFAPSVDDETEKIKSFVFTPGGWLSVRLYALALRIFAPAEWPFRLFSIKGKIPWKDVAFDCVVVRYLNGVARSQAWKLGPTYVDIDDLPIESYNTITRKRWPKLLGWLGAQVVSWWQGWLLRKCRGSWIASGEQVSFVEKYCPCVALPNLAMPASPEYRVDGPQKCQLMTVGLMSYAPNYEGVDWFVDNVWPLVRARCPNMTYVVCGGGVSSERKLKWSSVTGVEVRGFVKDVDPIYQESLGVVTPIMSGAGTCIKVIEALTRGRLVFANRFAVRGLSEQVVRDCRISVAETAQSLADMIVGWIHEDVAARVSEQSRVEAAAKMFSDTNTVLRLIEKLMSKVRSC